MVSLQGLSGRECSSTAPAPKPNTGWVQRAVMDLGFQAAGDHRRPGRLQLFRQAFEHGQYRLLPEHLLHWLAVAMPLAGVSDDGEDLAVRQQLPAFAAIAVFGVTLEPALLQ